MVTDAGRLTRAAGQNERRTQPLQQLTQKRNHTSRLEHPASVTFLHDDSPSADACETEHGGTPLQRCDAPLLQPAQVHRHRDAMFAQRPA